MCVTTEIDLSPEFIGVGVGLLIGASSWVTGYLVYRHERKKSFQEILYQRKMDAYQEILERCYATTIRLDVNSSPYTEIYEFKDQASWEAYWMTVNADEYAASFSLQDMLHKHAYILPQAILEPFQDFVNRSIHFVTVTTHFDTGILIDYMDKLWADYSTISDSIRADLHIEVIGKQLQRRITK